MDSVEEEVSRDEPLPDPPAPLLRTALMGKVVLLAGFLAVPGAFAGDFIGLGLAAASFVALVIWSGLVAANARRSRPATRHARPPRPVSAALSWLLAPIVGVGATFAIFAASDWAGSGSYDEEGSRNLAFVAVVVLSVVAIFAAMYRPYGILMRVGKWVSADSRRIRKWFIAPFIAAVCALTIQVVASLLIVADAAAEDSSGGASIGAVVLLLITPALPWVAWLITGSRAINSIQSGIAHTHGRAVRASLDPEAVSSNVAAYIHGAAGAPESTD